MFSKSFVSFVILAVLSGSAQARMRIVERDGRALYGRRFGQENPAVVQQISAACPGQTCGVIAGKSISTLLAAAPECAQQDLSDELIDASKTQDAATAAKMVALAITFRQVEKNTPPDFTTSPPTNRNSVFCQTPPRNAQLVGLNQAQDPANDPDVFFDPATKTSVKKGSQANTSPLGGGAVAAPAAGTDAATTSAVETATGTASSAVETATDVASSTTDAAPAATTTAVNNDAASTCPAVATVTVTVDAGATATATATTTDAAATETSAAVATETSAASTETSSAAAPAATDAATAPVSAGLPAGVDLGSCTDPTMTFGAGIEKRKETAFIPTNLKEFNHSSAQNSGIITQFICDTFVNSCKANAAAVTLCKKALADSAAAGLKVGKAADVFNAAFGFTTNFAAVQALDNQGNPA